MDLLSQPPSQPPPVKNSVFLNVKIIDFKKEEVFCFEVVYSANYDQSELF